MTIVLTGGGSGGHITPLLAVADALKKINPRLEIVYIGQKGDKLIEIPGSHRSIDKVYSVRAGKWRRYHGEGWRQIFDLRTVFKNFRDVFYMTAGIIQSRRLLKKLRPKVIFTPGGFVGVPVGIAARWQHIPFVTHDLDAHPGLANRINARWAAVHAVAMPPELYPYPPEKTKYVGVPIGEQFSPVDKELMTKYRHQLGLDGFGKMVFVTGGGLGAVRLNEAVISIAKELLDKYPDLMIAHAAGMANEKKTREAYSVVLGNGYDNRVKIFGYINDLYLYSGAADLVIARAGATNMAELAAQHKACIIVPNPLLTGGHQVKNAEAYESSGAIKVVTEVSLSKDPSVLLNEVSSLIDNPGERTAMGNKFGTFVKPDSTKLLAEIILSAVAE